MKEERTHEGLLGQWMYQIRALHDIKIVRWFYITGTGVILDLITFQVLTFLDFRVFMSNVVSSFFAISFVYFSSVRFVFIDKKYGMVRYQLFVCYYAIYIAVFSFVISTIVSQFGLYPLVAKIITLPVSFFVNYFFASKIV